jgi:hypothetical protein
MAKRDEKALERTLVAFAKGQVTLADLPLDSQDFWLFVIDRSARLARSSRTRAAADHLLARPLKGSGWRARSAALAQALANRDRRVRRRAIRVMHHLNLSTELEEAAARAAYDQDLEVRLEAVRLLAKHPSRRTMPTLLRILARGRDITEYLAMEAVIQIGPPAVPGLNALLAEKDSRIRHRATHCLAEIASPETLPGLLRALHDDRADVAWVAADGLLKLGAGVEVDVLRSMLKDPFTAVTIRVLRHYAEHTMPARIFRPIVEATKGPAASSATLVAVSKALDVFSGERRAKR